MFKQMPWFAIAYDYDIWLWYDLQEQDKIERELAINFKIQDKNLVKWKTETRREFTQWLSKVEGFTDYKSIIK